MPLLFDDIRQDIDVEQTRKNVELIFAKYVRNKIKIRETQRAITAASNFENDELKSEIMVAEQFTQFVDSKVNTLSPKQKEILELCYLKNENYFMDNISPKENTILKKLHLTHNPYYRHKREAILHFAVIYDFSCGWTKKNRLLVYKNKAKALNINKEEKINEI